MNRTVRKDVMRRYKQMLKDVSGENYHKGEVNCYTCKQCGKVTKTIDVDNGVTPFGIECPHCHGDAMSAFYHDTAPDAPVTHEFYRPTLEETLALVDEHFFTVSHILNGGLLRREKDA